MGDGRCWKLCPLRRRWSASCTSPSRRLTNIATSACCRRASLKRYIYIYLSIYLSLSLCHSLIALTALIALITLITLIALTALTALIALITPDDLGA